MYVCMYVWKQAHPLSREEEDILWRKHYLACFFGEKNKEGGLKDRRYKPKCIDYHANVNNPSRCVVQFYEKYLTRW